MVRYKLGTPSVSSYTLYTPSGRRIRRSTQVDVGELRVRFLDPIASKKEAVRQALRLIVENPPGFFTRKKGRLSGYGFGHSPDDPLESMAEMPPPGHIENPRLGRGKRNVGVL